MQTKYSCYFSDCSIEFEEEMDLYTHLLFTHKFYLPPCSTRLAEKQHLEAQALREEWRELQRQIMSKMTYVRHKFRNSIFNQKKFLNKNEERRGRQVSTLNRWLKNVCDGEGWIQVNDQKLYESTEYDALKPYLHKIYRMSRQRKVIEEKCSLMGYLLVI